MKVLEKNKAITLRKQGRTLSEILKAIPVSKGSLSYWLRDIKLTQEQLARIQYKNDAIKQKFINYNKLKKKQAQDRSAANFSAAINDIDRISEKELKLIGIALYWAEGYRKDSNWKVVNFTNSDPEMIKLMMKWFRVICRVPETKFRIRIQCHGSAGALDAEKHWSKIVNLPLAQFTRPYIRISPTSKRKMGHLSFFGICSIRISDNSLLTRIKGWIKGLSGAIV